jgi:2'-5' RNA ligase
VHRLFVAIEPPPHVRDVLLAAMGGIAGARWQRDDQFHLTLRFIGEVDRHQAQDVAAALAQVRGPAFDLALGPAGVFDRRGRVDSLWAGVTPADEVAALARRIDTALRRAGVPPETRAFVPHITLARFGRDAGPIGGFLDRTLPAARFRVDGFTLYESRLGHDGAAYDPIERYSLSPAGRTAMR